MAKYVLFAGYVIDTATLIRIEYIMPLCLPIT